jgi:hypothetical protein
MPVYLNSLDNTSSPLQFDFTAPDGSPIFHRFLVVDAGPAVLPVSGTYTATI